MTVPAGWKASIETTVMRIEKTIWHNEITKGIFKKQVVDTQGITNYRVIHNNSQILLKDVDDIVVMNQHRVSQSSYMGTSTGRYARFGYGSSTSKGISVGDVVFMYQGRPYIIFKQIADPNGVVRLAKSARKQLLTAIKAAEKLRSQSQKEVSKKTTTKRNIKENDRVNNNNNIANCPRCSSSNPKGSKYCNNCGFRIDNNINDTKTGQSNTAITSTVETTTKATTSFHSGESEFLTYQSPSYKIKIDYPANWIKADEDLVKRLVVGFKSPREGVSDLFLESVGISISQAPKKISLGQYVQLNVNDLKNKNPDLKIIESTSTSLSGMPAHRLIYNKEGRTYLNLIIIKPNDSSNNNNTNNAVYIIAYVAENTRYPIYLPIAQKIINSFEFID
jgi:hypothetical protein